MLTRQLLLSTLIPMALCAQVPAPRAAVKILLNVEPPAKGTQALDAARLATALQSFASSHQIEQPAPDGDGWILGIGLNTRWPAHDYIVAGGTLRLSKIQSGKLSQDKPVEAMVLIFARDIEHLDDALAHELVQKGWGLLSDAHVIEKNPTPNLGSIHEPTLEADGKVLDLPFPMVKVSKQAPQPPYPPDARGNRVQGTVILEVTADTSGVPESVRVVTGPGPLLAYAATYLLNWRFSPMVSNGHPVRTRFWMHLNFRVQ